MVNFNDINFLDAVEGKSKKKTGPILYTALGVVIVMLFADSAIKSKSEIVSLRDEEKYLTEELQNVQTEVMEIQALLNVAMEQEAEEMENPPEVVIDTFEEDFNMRAAKTLYDYAPLDHKMIVALATTSPEGVFITSYEVNKEYFNLKGYSKNPTVVASLSYNLRQNEFIKDVTINSTELVSNEGENNFKYDLYSFEIFGNMKGVDIYEN